MKFWRGNKIDAPFDMTSAEVAAAFYKALMEDKHDERLKWFNWPRYRVVLDWMTSPDGLNAAWEDRTYIESILDDLELTAPPGSLGECDHCGGEYPVQDSGTKLAPHSYELPDSGETVSCPGGFTKPIAHWRF